MIKEGRIGLREATFLMILTVISKGFYTSVETLIILTGTAAWYSTLVSCLTSVIFFLLVYLLMKRFPGKDLAQVFENVTGKIIGKAFSLVFVLYFIYYAGSNLREFLEMIKAYNLPYTPPSFIIFTFLLVVAVMAYIGLEGIARLATAWFYPTIIGIIVILVLAHPFYETGALFPIGGFGLMKTLQVGFLRSSAYNEVIILAFIINSLQSTKSLKNIGVSSLIASGLIISASTFCSLMAFEYTQGRENLSALFQMARIIYYNRFLQRIETIFLLIWIIASLVNIGLAFYISLSIFCKAFKVEDHRPLIFPFVFSVFMVTFYPESISQVTQVNITFIRSYSSGIVYGIPVLVLLLSLILGKKGEKQKHAER